MTTFKPGDKVQIINKITEQEGWDNNWFSSGMDSYINNGITYTISNYSNPRGIRLNEDPHYLWPSNCFKLAPTPSIQDRVQIRCKRLWNKSSWVKNNPQQAY